MLESIGDSLGTLVAAALGGTLALLGSISALRANLRQQNLEKKAEVYQELLQVTHRMEQAKSTSETLAEIGKQIEKLADQTNAMAREIVQAATARSLDPSDATSRLLKLQKRTRELQFRTEQETIFLEDPDDIAADAKLQYRQTPRWALYFSPLVTSQYRLTNFLSDPDFHPDLSPMLHRELRRLEATMRRELAWAGRNVVWRAALVIYSIRIRLRNRRIFRRVRKIVKQEAAKPKRSHS
jgi:hypothetical protein